MSRVAPDAGLEEERFAVSPAVRILKLAGRSALFCGRRQQLFELNATAAEIWRGLAAGASTSEAGEGLRRLGASRDEACAYVAQAALDWTDLGLLVPAAVQQGLARPPLTERVYRLDGLAVRLSLHGSGALDAVDSAFGHLEATDALPTGELALAPYAGGWMLFVNGASHGRLAPEALVPGLKAILTDLYAGAVDEGFLVHAALLKAGERTLLLTGEPGAGKTTLTLALAAAGMTYGGDDIVRISPDGLARPAPFAAAVKAGAWPLLSGRLPQVDHAPTHRRADGQEVRYVLPPTAAAFAPAAPDLVLVLRREAGAAPRLEPMHPLDALCVLLDSAFARRGAADPDGLTGFAQRLEHAACGTFVYSDLDAAVAAVEALAR
ncbi:MAG: hypothetical protein ACK41C_01845 [Phenylobacterium sp.]|uniref:hypothetical protein n=1 Tax=Phenylobacterium sp. TaxID=1871053 RepID=UPI0039197BA2